MRKIFEQKIEDYCDSCVFCNWGTDNCNNIGWFCVHRSIDRRLILVKEDYDHYKSRHIFIPDWCPLEAIKKKI